MWQIHMGLCIDFDIDTSPSGTGHPQLRTLRWNTTGVYGHLRSSFPFIGLMVSALYAHVALEQSLESGRGGGGQRWLWDELVRTEESCRYVDGNLLAP